MFSPLDFLVVLPISGKGLIVMDSKKPGNGEDYYAECTSSDCDWRGLSSECYALGEIGPLCPVCKDTTEHVQVIS